MYPQVAQMGWEVEIRMKLEWGADGMGGLTAIFLGPERRDERDRNKARRSER